MKLTLEHGVLSVSAFCTVIAVVVLSFFFLTASGWQGSKALFPGAARRCVLEWGRLASFPASAERMVLTTEGGAFSRAFRARFRAPTADVERWLRASPGITIQEDMAPKKALPAQLIHVGGATHFEIVPGGGAAHAEVNVGVIDEKQSEVTIYVYWS